MNKAGMDKHSWHKIIKLLTGFICTVVFLYLAIKNLDWEYCASALKEVDCVFIIVGIFMLAIGYTFRIVRWWLMLREINPEIRIIQCAGPFLNSIALNNILPFRAGDIFRIMGFRSQLQISASPVLASMIVERILDVITLSVFLLITMPFIQISFISEGILSALSVVFGICLLVILVLLLFSFRIREYYEEHFKTPVNKSSLFNKLLLALGNVLNGLALFGTPGLFVKLLPLSIGVWLFEGAVFASAALALNIKVVYLGPWFSLSVGTLATMIPSAPGYIGTFDYFAMHAMMAYGVEANDSVLFALIVHILLWAPLTIVGLVWLWASFGSAALKNIYKGENDARYT